ncbi:MAG: efflux RND transporter permease subunit [Arenicella sp.]|nr:efflux RND transporter permease subunit [Arenicella sp.]
MNLTQIAINNNRTLLVLVFALFITGISSFFSLPKQQDPGFTIRTAVISTRFEGASPERVEQLVTKKIEEKVQEMPEIDFITSESLPGISIIQVNFQERYTDMRPIFDNLRRKVDDIQSELPEGVPAPQVNDEYGDIFGSVYSLTGEGFSYAELLDVADQIRDQLLKDPDVAKVKIHGAQQQRVFIDYKSAILNELGLSPRQLSGILSRANIVSAGGSIVSGTERITLEPTGNFESVEDIRRTVISIPNVGLVYLSDIAKVYLAYEDPPSKLTRVKGERALAIGVSMRDGGDILKLGARLDALMPALERKYPWGISIEKIWFQADLVEVSIDNFVTSLSQSVMIVVAVMLIFLGLRTGLVVATLIPFTMMISFYFMQVFSITINQISLAALIISLGLLVDNAIVIVESVLVKRNAGIGAVQAAVESGKELATPLLVSSLTTAAAFMPIGLAESAVGEYTSDIFYVVAIALLVSWFLAMTFLPLLTVKAIKSPQGPPVEDALDGPLYTLYSRCLSWSLRNRLISIGAIVVVFLLSIMLMRFVPQIFIEPSEDPVFTAKLEMPLGTSIETTTKMVEDLDSFIKREYGQADGDIPAPMSSRMTFIGEGGPRLALTINPPNQNPANAFLIANTRDGQVVDEVINGIEAYLTKAQPDLSKQISRLENGPPVGYPIVVRIQGDDVDQLYRIADTVTEILYSNAKVLSVKNSWGLPSKKLKVEVNQERAQRAGVSSEDVAYSLRANLQGQQLSQFRDDDDLVPIILRADVSDREDISKLDGLSVYSQSTGNFVPLRQVADVKLVFEAGVIEHRDRVKTLSLKVQLKPEFNAAEVTAEIEPLLSNESGRWPDGYQYELGGESSESGDAGASIAAKLPIALLVILMLLVSQFNSIRSPIIILVTIPLGLIGVINGLIFAGSSFGFFTILGIIALSGIIINNAIVLIDRINVERFELDKEPRDAIMHACKQRLRPIFLATATTVLGMMPLVWGGTAMFKPMAISIIFGLSFATLLTLLVVPVLYSLFYRVSFAAE